MFKVRAANVWQSCWIAAWESSFRWVASRVDSAGEVVAVPVPKVAGQPGKALRNGIGGGTGAQEFHPSEQRGEIAEGVNDQRVEEFKVLVAAGHKFAGE